MLRIIITALALSAAGPLAAHGDDPMHVFYGNSLEVTEKDGVRQLSIDPDGRFSIGLPNGKSFQGTWQRSGSRLCFHVGKDEACFTDMLGHAVGQAWTGREEGHSDDYQAIIRPGRESRPAAHP